MTLPQLKFDFGWIFFFLFKADKKQKKTKQKKLVTMNASKTNNLKNKRSTANNLQSNRELDSLNYHELTELYTKTAAMLNNAYVSI